MDLRNFNGPQSLGEFDVIVIGGGITGAGTARDCATRGLRVLLVATTPPSACART